MTTARDASVHPDRYGSLLTQGTLQTTGLQLSSATVVLPFICAHQGILWVGGLLYPAYSVGIIIGNLMAPFILEISRRHRHLVVAATALVIAPLIMCNAIAAENRVQIAFVFLATSFATGVANGVWKVAYSDVLSSKLSEVRRSDVLLTQGAASAVLAIAATLALIPVVDPDNPLAGHVDLLWLGAAGLIAAGIAAVFVGPLHSSSTLAGRGIGDTYRQGMTVARSHQWFRRYVVTQLMFVPIILGVTFYSLHAAEEHGDKPASLHSIVILMSVGLIVGSVVWRIVYRRFGSRGMLLISALMGSVAALISIVSEAFDILPQVWTHGIVILLATVANQAVLAAAISWINVYAAEHHRATLIGFGAMLVATETFLLGAALAGIAEKWSAIWAVAIILVLNVAAAVAALQAPARA